MNIVSNDTHPHVPNPNLLAMVHNVWTKQQQHAAKHYTVVHICCHGYFGKKKKKKSYILFL